MPAAEPIEVRLLGPLEVHIAGVVVPVPGRRPRALLAVLALSAGQPVPVETIYRRVWGEELPGDVRGSLYTCVRRLRSALGDESISNDAGRYALQIDPDAVDALRFARLLDQAQRASSAERAALLREALALWGGTPFTEPLSDWLNEDEAHRLAERYLAAVQQRIDLDLAADRHADVVTELQELTASNPLRESLWARLLVVLDKLGRPAEALDAYERVRVRLADELGIDPSPELQGIHAALLAGTPVEPASMSSTGRTAVVPQQLPGDTGMFAGRKDALRLLDKQLAEAGDERQPILITALSGLGGIGKTTLALHWAHRVRDHFADGQLFVNLRGYGPGEPLPPSAALDTLLRGLGVPGDQIPADLDGRSALFRSLLAGRRVLLLLDNARDADQVRPLLPGAGSMVLVTSRGQLRGLAAREGARRIALDTLSGTEAQALLENRLGDLGAPEAGAALAELAELCGYLPLALVIAAERAARQPTGGLHEFIEELRDERERLTALDAGDDETTNLRSVFSWSYRALDADTARMFRLLGLPPGVDLSPDAAAALAGTTLAAARRLLDRLVDRSLVRQKADGRFELHDHVRAYAAELAHEHDRADDRQAALDRIYDWCLHSVTNAKQPLYSKPPLLGRGEPLPGVEPMTFEDRDQALAWLSAERDVLLAMARTAAQAGSGKEAYRLVHAIWNPVLCDGPADEMLRLTKVALSAAQQTGDRGVEAQSNNLLGLSYQRTTNYEQAHIHQERAFALFGEIDHTRGQAVCLANLCATAFYLERFADAAEYAEQGLAVARLTGDPLDQATPLNHLTHAYLALGRYDEAAEACLRAIEILQRVGHPNDDAHILDALGKVRIAQGRHVEAVECFRLAADHFRSLQRPSGEGAVLTSLGRVHRHLGRPEEARACWARALRILDEVGKDELPEFSRAELIDLVASVSSARRR